MTQLALPANPRFDGAAYDRERDDARLTGQLLRIFDQMKDGRWRTLSWIADSTGDPEASISAQLRHLRKARFGGHTVEREHLGNGLYQYRLIVNPCAAEVIAAAYKTSHHRIFKTPGTGDLPESASPAPANPSPVNGGAM